MFLPLGPLGQIGDDFIKLTVYFRLITNLGNWKKDKNIFELTLCFRRIFPNNSVDYNLYFALSSTKTNNSGKTVLIEVSDDIN